MKKLITLLTICLLAVSAWGDVGVEERFAGVSQDKSSGSTGATWTGDICNWFAVYARRKSTGDLINSKQATWLSMDTDANPRGYIKTTNLEGGIKYVEFPYAQFDTETDNFLKLEVRAIASSDGVTILKQKEETRGEVEDEGINKATGETYTWDCACKANAQLQIINTSVKRDGGGTPTSGNMPRWLVGNVTITPYLRYQQKSVTIGLPNKGYINRNLIDNTDGGTITYSIHDKNAETKNVADVDESTGAVTPKAAGTAVVTASWEGVTTTYELTVSPTTYLEAFSKNATYASSTSTDKKWDGDVIPSWDVHLTTRRDQDTIGGYYVHGTYLQTKGNDDSNQGYLRTTSDVEGGVKAISYAWRQHPSGEGCTFRIAANYDETEIAKNADVAGTTEGWTIQNVSGTNSTKLSNAILEIRNISNKGGSKDPRVILSPITITPYILYYTKEATLNMRVESANPTQTYTNQGFINNTTGPSVVSYSIVEKPSGISASINASTGQVTIGDRFQTGDITVQAAWNSVTTKYVLHVLGKTATTASYETAVKKIGLDEDPTNVITVTDGYDGTISYASSRPDVVKVVNNELQVVGVGVTTITATLSETENYGGTTASYTVYVTDNSASVQVEAFSQVTAGNAAAHKGQLWQGDVCAWRVSSCGGVRKSTDVFASDQERVGIWMGTPEPNTNYSSLTAENGVEGGIKHIWFYVEQPYNTSETGYTLKPVIYLTEAVADNKVADVEVVGTAEPINIAANRKLLGASNVTKSNSVLIIRNESYKTDDKTRPAIDPGRGRFLLDDIHITPWLLYTTKEATLDMTDGTMTYKNTSLIDNTEEGHISYTSSDTDIAKVASDGTVTATGLKGGEVRITATWSDVGAGAYTYYDLTVIPKQYTNLETFDNITTATANYSTTLIRRAGVAAEWSAILGGFNPGVDKNGTVDHNCARFRAPYTDVETVPYVESSTIPGGIKSLRFKCQAGGKETTSNGDISWDIRVLINGEPIATLTDLPLNASEGWKPIDIPNINVAGDFVIRFENHSIVPEEDNYNSTNSNAGNRGRLLIDDIEWEGLPMALEDDADNSTVIENNAGYKRNVMLADRTIRTGGYNTLCLPFAMSAEQLAESPLAGGKVYNFTNAYLGADNLDIRFEKVNAMEAGKPYLVTVPADVENPVFEGVTISKATTNNVIQGENMRFIGSFNQGTMNETGLYVVANSLYRVSNITSGDKTIGACRAYFDVPTGSPALAPSVRMRIVTHTDHATGMEQINQKPQTNGQKVIRDGQLYIIHNGAMYNVQGARVK